MRILELLASTLAWIVFGAVIWAVAPILVKLLSFAQQVHQFFN